MPDKIYEYTPREYANMSKAMSEYQERFYEDMAVKSIMQARAMHEDNISVDKLTGKTERENKRKEIEVQEKESSKKEKSIEEKKADVSALSDRLGKVVNK